MSWTDTATTLPPEDDPGLDAAVAAALASIAAATDLDALKQARLEHAGARSPIALANRGIGALPPAARAAAARRIGDARDRVNAALAARRRELDAQRAGLLGLSLTGWATTTANVLFDTRRLS